MTAIARWLAGAVLASLIGGCAPRIPPLPAQAAVQPKAQWRTPPSQSEPVTIDWWRQFGDPVLSQLVARALFNNTDTATAVERVREARTQEALARSALVPSLDFGVSGSRARIVSAFGTEGESTTVTPVFQAAYEADLFGRVRDQVEAARQGVLASAAARDTVSLGVAAATASGYVTLRALDARLELVRATTGSRAEALRIARNRARTGYTSDLELRQAEAEYDATAQIVPQVEQAIARQENALSLLLGDNPHPIPRGLALTALNRPPAPDVLPSEVVRGRPDIAQAEYALAASDATLAAARAQFLPRLNLAASAGAVASSALGDPITIWSLGGSVLAPLFNGGRNTAQFDAAVARRNQAAIAYRRSVLTAFREVEDNLAALARLREQVAILERQRTAYASALTLARNRYAAGYSPYLEQLDAQRALLAAEQTLIQARADELTATIALYQAVGGGWR